MRQRNKIFGIALILVVLTLIISSITSAGPLETAKNYLNNTWGSVTGFWDRIDDYVTSLTFWINFGIVLAIIFVLIQSYEALRNLREGNPVNMTIMYILLIVIAIIVAVHLGPNRIYHHQYIRWLFNTNIIINIVVIYIAIELIFTFFGTQLPFIERLLRRGERGEPQQGFANILRYLVPIIISIMIVYHVAQVDSKGIPTNTSLIWQSDFWKNIERIGFGDRNNNRIGDWKGTYTNANGDTRYGVLHWKPIKTGTVPPTIQLGNTSVPSPALPPIVIFLILWILLRATIGRIVTPEMFGQNAEGANARDTENLELGANEIRTILILYLAFAITARGIEVNNLIMFLRIFLMWQIYRALQEIDLLPAVRGQQGGGMGMSVPGRVITAWIVSGLLIKLLINRDAPVDLGWIWTIVAFEMVYHLAIPITATIANLITAAVAHPGITGGVAIGAIIAAIGPIRDRLLTPLLDWLQTGLGPLIINVVESFSTALEDFIGNIKFIAIPIASKKNNSKDILKIFEGKNIVITVIIFGIIIIIGGAVKSNLKPNITFVILSAIVGLIVGIIAGKKGWVRLRKEGMNKQFAEKLEKYENETKKESKKVTTSKGLRNIVEWLRMKFARNEHQSATSEVVFGKKVENVENRLPPPQTQEPRQQIQRQFRSQYKTFNQPQTIQQPQQRQVTPQFQKLIDEAKGNPFTHIRQTLPRATQENVNMVNRPTRNINRQVNRR